MYLLLYECVDARTRRLNMRLPFSPPQLQHLSSRQSPRPPLPHSPHVAPSFTHRPHFSSHPGLITQIRSFSNHLAELGSAPLNTPRSPHPFELMPSVRQPIQLKPHEYCRSSVMSEGPLVSFHHCVRLEEGEEG